MLQYTQHTHQFNGPFSGTTQVSRYQKGKTNLDFTEQETVSGSGISWAIYKSAPRSRQITTPAPHHSVFHRPDALPAAQPTASKHTTPTKKVNKQFVYYTAKVKKAISKFWTLKKDKHEPQHLRFVLTIFGTMQICMYVCMYIE